MKIAVFLISFCLFLMSGADRVFAGQHSRNCCYARTYHHEMEGKRNIADLDAAPANHSFITAENNYLFFDSPEDDRDSDTELRKSKRVIKYESLLSYQTLLSRLNHHFDTAPPYWPQESDKYILQRVFRV
jgi:hypothetical protein